MRFILTMISVFIWHCSFCQIKKANRAEDRYELIPYLTESGYGYADRDGNLKIDPQYERASLFDSVGYAIVSLNGKEGLINEKGDVVVPFIFDSRKYFWNKNPNYVQFKDWNGNYSTNKNLRYFKKYQSLEHIIYKVDNPWKFSEVFTFKSLTRNEVVFNGEYGKVKQKDGKINFIDQNLQKVFNIGLYKGNYLGHGLFAEANEKNRVRLIDKNKIALTDFNYYSIGSAKSNEYFVVKSTGKYGLLDITGQLVKDTIYDHIRDLGHNVFLLTKKQTYGVLITSLDTIINFRDNQIYSFGNGFYHSTDKGIICYNKYGKKTFGPEKIIAHSNSHLFPILELNNSFIVLNPNGKQILEFNHEIKIPWVKNDYIVVKNKTTKQYTLFSKFGKSVLNRSFELVMPTILEDWFIIRDGLLGGVYSLTDGWIYPMEKQEVSTFSNPNYPSGYVRIIRFDSIITHQNKIDNIKVTKPKKLKESRIHYGKDTTQVLFKNGRIIKYKKDRSLSLLRNKKGEIYYSKQTEPWKNIVLDSFLQPILPSYVVDYRSMLIRNEIFFKGINQNKDEGLFRFNGEVVFPIKKDQKIEYICKGFLEIGPKNDIMIYNDFFKPISKKPYVQAHSNSYDKNIKLQFYGKNKDESIDIFDSDGVLISSGEYKSMKYDAVRDHVSVSKEKKHNTIRCIINKKGVEVFCDSFLYLIPIMDKELKYIFRNKHGYGVLDSVGQEIFKPKYKKISYNEDIKALLLYKKDNTLDIVKNNEIIVANTFCKGSLNVKQSDSLIIAKSDNFYFVFNSNGKLINKLYSFWGSLFTDPNSHKTGIIKFITKKNNHIYLYKDY